MRRTPLVLTLTAALLLTVTLTSLTAQSTTHGDDEAAVRAAVLDYVEGIYEVAPERIERSVHPELRKIGYYRADADWREAPMTYDQLVELAATWNQDGQRLDPATAPKEIEIFEVQDKTASAKLTAHWGTDYFHLAKLDGRWMIVNVLWQSLPEDGE